MFSFHRRNDGKVSAETVAKAVHMTVGTVKKYLSSLTCKKLITGEFSLAPAVQLTDDRKFFTLPNEIFLQFGLLYFVPGMIGLSMSDMDAYSKFIAGKNFDILCKVLSCMTDYTYQDWLGISKADHADIDSAVMEKIKEVYNTVFADTGNGCRADYETRIGEMSFTEQTKREIMDIATLLAPCADYDFS